MFGGMIDVVFCKENYFRKKKETKMKDTLTINGKLYVHTPEVKEDGVTYIFLYKKRGFPHVYETTCPQHQTVDELITVFRNERKLREGEIIVSEAELSDAWNRAFPISANGSFEKLCKELFKKDGV